MPNQVLALRSATAGIRPGGRLPGELYVNWPDKQLGVIDNTSSPLDLLAIRFFSSTTSYNPGDYVVNSGILYSAKNAITPGPFNSLQWLVSGGTVIVSDNPPAPTDGLLWFDSVGSQLYVQYNDGSSSQWVVAVNNSGITDAPIDGTTYARNSANWAHLTHSDITDWAASVPAASTTNPLMSGTVAIGSATTWARADHVHPTDTSRAAATALANYLPLTGGTLTGALNGTSIVLSGGLQAITTISIAGPSANANAYMGFFQPAFATRQGYIGYVNNGIILNNDITGAQINLPAGGGVGVTGTITAGVINCGNITASQVYAAGGASVLGANHYFGYPTATSFVAYTASGYNYFQFQSGWYWRWNTSSGQLDWIGNNAVWVSILTDGSVNSTAGFRYQSNAAIGWAWSSPFLNTYVGGTYIGGLIYSTGAANQWQISWIAVNTNGNAYATASGSTQFSWPVTSSDIRLKKNIVPANKDALVAINSLKVVEADMKPFEGAANQHWNWILTANQELDDAIPHSYVAPPDEDKYASVNTYPLVAALIKAVQQLTARVAALEVSYGS